MLINEVCKECNLTKKALEYYMERGLVFPSVQENGYRCFSNEDVVNLKKISILRSLGLSVTDIRSVLSGKSTAALSEICHRKALQMTVLQEKQALMQELAKNYDWEYVQSRLEQLQKKQTVLERLMDGFPGYYGNFLCLHFAPYLNEPVMTDEQQEAFDIIASFLDKIDFDIPADLKKYLDEAMLNLDANLIENISVSVNAAVHDMERYIADNDESG